MQKRSLAVKILAIAGTALVWLSLLAPFAFGVLRWARAGWFQVDYLMPAELFPVALAGGLCLITATLLARSYRRLLIGSFGMAVIMLVGFQALAVVTGLASGEIEPQGVWWALVLAGVSMYIAALLATGIAGILMVRRQFRPGAVPAAVA